MAKTRWMIKNYQGTNGWVVFDTCKTAKAADETIARVCKEQGVPYTDFIVKPVKMVF